MEPYLVLVIVGLLCAFLTCQTGNKDYCIDVPLTLDLIPYITTQALTI